MLSCLLSAPSGLLLSGPVWLSVRGSGSEVECAASSLIFSLGLNVNPENLACKSSPGALPDISAPALSEGFVRRGTSFDVPGICPTTVALAGEGRGGSVVDAFAKSSVRNFGEPPSPLPPSSANPPSGGLIISWRRFSLSFLETFWTTQLAGSGPADATALPSSHPASSSCKEGILPEFLRNALPFLLLGNGATGCSRNEWAGFEAPSLGCRVLSVAAGEVVVLPLFWVDVVTGEVTGDCDWLASVWNHSSPLSVMSDAVMLEVGSGVMRLCVWGV